MLLTDRPETAKWLSADEKALASARVKSENAGQTAVVDKLSKKALKQGIMVPSTLAIAFIFLLNNITVQAVAIFTPTIVKTIYPHKTTIQLQLQTVPPYIVGAFFVLLFPYLAWKTKRRGLYMLISAPLMVIGYIIFVATENPQARYAATFIIMAGAFPFGALCNGWASINVASDSARASAIGMVAMCGNIGALISTWTFLPKDAPNYINANSINIGTGSGIIITAALLLVWMLRDNKKRDMGRYDDRLEGLSTDEITDLGNDHPGFRYRY
jgi:sugar phosphate permease